jgi:uncharacterized membrane protein (DUF2068 family)
MQREPGLTLIIAWKWGRAGLSLLGAVAAAVLVLTGLAPRLQAYAVTVHDHAVTALSLAVTKLFVSAVEPTHMLVLAGALALDGATLLLEGWALFRGKLWGAWLVVGATGLLVPFELVALVRHPSVIRALVLLVNGLIVGWLIRHAIWKHRAHHRADAPRRG